MFICILPSRLRVQIRWRLCLFAWLSWLSGTPGSVVSLARPQNPPDRWSWALRAPPAIPSTLLSVSPTPAGEVEAEPGAGWGLGGLRGIRRRRVALGVECHKGSPCLGFALNRGWTLGIPHKQARCCPRSRLDRVTADGLCGLDVRPCLCSGCSCSALARPSISPLLWPGSASSPTRLTDSSPTGKTSSRPPTPAPGFSLCWSPSRRSPAAESGCCPLVGCSAGRHWGHNGIPPLVDVDARATTSWRFDWKTPSGTLKRKQTAEKKPF